MSITLVLGGARSGKSRHAQALAETRSAASGGALIYIATAQAFDDEMTDRITRHRADRDARWTTLEAPIDLPEAIAGCGSGAVVLVDCLTLWLSNVLLAELPVAERRVGLVAAASAFTGDLILVSNEVGWGIVPDNPLARRFRDEAGWLHQNLAAVADSVTLVVAGLPLTLK